MFNPRIQLLILATALLVSACGTASRSYDQGLQHAALTRWSQCIDRQTQTSAIQVVDAMESQGDNCQGHKRDVVESFPPHLASRVDEILKERRQQRAASRLLQVADPEASARHILLVREDPTH